MSFDLLLSYIPADEIIVSIVSVSLSAGSCELYVCYSAAEGVMADSEVSKLFRSMRERSTSHGFHPLCPVTLITN